MPIFDPQVRSMVPAYDLVTQALSQRAQLESKRPGKYGKLAPAARAASQALQQEAEMQNKIFLTLMENNLATDREKRRMDFESRFDAELTEKDADELIENGVPESIARAAIGMKFKEGENRQKYAQSLIDDSDKKATKAMRDEYLKGILADPNTTDQEKFALLTEAGQEEFAKQLFKSQATPSPSDIKGQVLRKWIENPASLNDQERMIIADDIQDPYMKQALDILSKSGSILGLEPGKSYQLAMEMAAALRAEGIAGKAGKAQLASVPRKTQDAFMATLKNAMDALKKGKTTPDKIRTGIKSKFGQYQILVDVLEKQLSDMEGNAEK